MTTNEERPTIDDDPDAPPSAEELAASERLRDAFDDPSTDHPDVELARALRHAHAPKPLEAATHRRILERVLPRAKGKTSVWYPIGVFAAAAGIFVAAVSVLESGRAPLAPQNMAASVGASLVHVHATEDLFPGGFPEGQKTTDRIDVISKHRARDLRDNMYAKWGVK